MKTLKYFYKCDRDIRFDIKKLMHGIKHKNMSILKINSYFQISEVEDAGGLAQGWSERFRTHGTGGSAILSQGRTVSLVNLRLCFAGARIHDGSRHAKQGQE